jgi:2-aminoadipate transaminase
VDVDMAITLAQRADGFEASMVRELLAVGERPGMRSLAGGLPDPCSFPADRLEAAARSLFQSPSRAERALQYGPTDGMPELRELLTTTPAVQRVTGATPDELVVTTGSQQAVHLLATVLTDPGDAVVVDDPCYLGARQVFGAVGARLVGVPLDEHGLRTDVLAGHLRAGLRPRLVYTVPAYQNPSGAVLSTDRGAALVALARRYGFVVIEDDAYGALGFDAGSPPSEPLGTDAPDVVVTLGTVSKVLAPGLRVGWLRAPAELRAAIVRTKQAVDLHTSTLTQSLVADLLADRAFLHAHLARIRGHYASRGAALAGALAESGALFARPRGGLFMWVRMPGVDTSALFEAALDHDVMFVPGRAFAVDESWREHMRLSFATLPEATLRACANEIVQLARRV